MAGFASKRQAAWGKFSDPWLGINGWSNVMTKEEALKLALEALETLGEEEWVSDDDYGMMQVYDADKVNEALTAIKEALAQDELCSSQEPVEKIISNLEPLLSEKNQFWVQAEKMLRDLLYTTPPKREWVGLTDEDIAESAAQGHQRWKEYAQAIEAKLKEKNT